MCEHFDTLTETKDCFKSLLGEAQDNNETRLTQHKVEQEKVIRSQSNILVVLYWRVCDAALPDCQDKVTHAVASPKGWMGECINSAALQERILLLVYGPHSWDESLTNPQNMPATIFSWNSLWWMSVATLVTIYVEDKFPYSSVQKVRSDG